MVENILNPKYTSAVNSYNLFNTSSKIIGTLVEKINKSVKLDIGENRTLNIELKEDIDAEVGDKVAIDRSNILKSKVTKTPESISFEKRELNFYATLLEEFNAEISRENLSALKKMSSYGIEPSRENFESYLIAKDSFRQIELSLDYESAIKLVEQDLDLEGASIQTIALKLKDIDSEKDGDIMLSQFPQKALTTEQAESIAKELYGSRMGKDILDIIKSLHKEGVAITKKNVEKISDVFYKLGKLEDVDGSVFIDALKGNLDINIDNLYRVNSYSQSSPSIQPESNASAFKLRLASSGYASPIETDVFENSPEVSDEKIAEFLESIGIESSNENIELARKFIKSDIEVSPENIDNLKDMRESLSKLVENLDYEKATLLEMQGVDIDQDDIRSIAKELELLESLRFLNPNVDSTEIELLDPKSIPLKLESLSQIEESELILLLKRNTEFKISSLEQFDLRIKAKPFSESEHPTYSAPPSFESVSKIASVFSELKTLDLNTVAIQLKKNLPLTLSNIWEVHSSLYQEESLSKYSRAKIPETESVISVLSQNGITVSSQNMRKVSDIYRSFNNLRAELTSVMISKAVSENIALEDIDIVRASDYVDKYRKNSQDIEVNRQSYAKSFKDSAYELARSGESSLLFLLKNKKPLLFGELKKTHSLIKNTDQLGHKLSEVSKLLTENPDESVSELLQKLRESVQSISESLKVSKEDIERAHRDFESQIKGLEKDPLLKNAFKEVVEKLEDSKRSASESRVIQLPVYMNEQFSNLNMFFRDRKNNAQGKNAEDISAILSIQTSNLGNLNISLDIEKKDVSVKMGLEDPKHTRYLENSIESLSKLLDKSGYSLKSFELYEKDIDAFEEEFLSEEHSKMPTGMLDITI